MSIGSVGAYIDTCVLSATVKNELTADDAHAVSRLEGLIAAGRFTAYTSTVVYEELRKIPDRFQGQHVAAYDSLRRIVGHPTTSFLDDRATSATFGQTITHPIFASLRNILPDENDARHLFQAHMNGLTDFITVDQRTILSKAPEICKAIGVRVWTPSDYVRSLSSRVT